MFRLWKISRRKVIPIYPHLAVDLSTNTWTAIFFTDTFLVCLSFTFQGQKYNFIGGFICDILLFSSLCLHALEDVWNLALERWHKQN